MAAPARIHAAFISLYPGRVREGTSSFSILIVGLYVCACYDICLLAAFACLCLCFFFYKCVCGVLHLFFFLPGMF